MNELTCAAARELLLDADPTALHARGDSPLERHLRTCTTCAAAAQHMLRAQSSLAAALAALTRADGYVHTDARAVSGQQSRGSSGGATVRARRRWLATTAPLAAAAVLLLVLWQTQLRQTDVAFEPILLPQEEVPDVPVVNVPETGTVAVMQTSNPNITVVWHF